jgi:hypothetical protein
MTTWTKQRQLDPESHTITFGELVAGVVIKFGDGYKFGDTINWWTQETQQAATVEEE